MTDQRPKGRRLFSLTALAIGLAVLAVIGIRGVDYALKRQAIRGIESLGGVVYFDDEPPHLPHAARGFQSILKEFALLREPVFVGISGKGATDAALDDILSLGSLHTVSLTNVAVTDQALTRLARLRSLKYVNCTRDPRNAALWDALGQPTQIDFTELPLPDCVAYLGDYHNLPFVIDSAALGAAGLRDDLPMTYETLTRTTLAEALDQMLSPHPLGWVVRDGAIVVTSRREAGKTRRVVDALRRDLPRLKEVWIDAN